MSKVKKYKDLNEEINQETMHKQEWMQCQLKNTWVIMFDYARLAMPRVKMGRD